MKSPSSDVLPSEEHVSCSTTDEAQKVHISTSLYAPLQKVVRLPAGPGVNLPELESSTPMPSTSPHGRIHKVLYKIMYIWGKRLNFIKIVFVYGSLCSFP